ncbi:hypothetical protein NliqN6_1156 [Naganishia liquefaciens]|uniref:Uncharacterized protein n=1 Tax=Naganishia liquefaciens TaxID=104408 RepID=A0A8H3TR47_9TREE|nr:hypothetical protein NliqN6_1156 [Naganishia liquefaciens]
MQHVGRDGLLYGGHMPGDDNFHHALTNVDFRVTPPVRRSSITLSPQPEFQFESYFQVPKSSEPAEVATPKQGASALPQEKIGDRDQGQGETPSQSTPGNTTAPVNSVMTSGTAAGQPKDMSEVQGAKGQITSDAALNTSNATGTTQEKAFGTNLTTGHREYLSQYTEPNSATESVGDGEESVASRFTQDDTFSIDSGTTEQMSTCYTDSSLSRDESDLGDSDSTLGTDRSEQVDIY